MGLVPFASYDPGAEDVDKSGDGELFIATGSQLDASAFESDLDFRVFAPF